VLSLALWLVALHVPDPIYRCQTKQKVSGNFLEIDRTRLSSATYQSSLDDSTSGALIQAEVPSLSCAIIDRVFRTLELLEILLYSCEFGKDSMLSSFNPMKTKISWTSLAQEI
jgi:hypothetical protein